MPLEDKVNEETKHYVKMNCASGPIPPLLDRPLWPMHTYMGNEERKLLYCSVHQEVYDKIKARERLDELDGK